MQALPKQSLRPKEAIAATQSGVSERHVAAECERATIEAGGTFPGFGLFIRSTASLAEEHTTWSDRRLGPGDCLFLELSGCVERYHAPLGRLVHIGPAPPDAVQMADIAGDALKAVIAALRPGTLFRDVYASWKRSIDRAGLSHYHRHHCGYLVGIGFPPSWTGGNRVVGLSSESTIVVEPGMVFHVLSWLMGTGRGDFFVSNTVLVDDKGPEVVTRTHPGICER
jgi:Xaa-Pro dipeptidase